MDPDRWGKLEALYEAAVGLEPDRRSAYLAEQCAGDEALRQEVESLLFHGENAGDFLRAPAPVKPLEVGQRVAHYEIQQKLGEGGMGAVYRAYDSQLRRPVALKVLPPEFAADPERRQRLLREARAASALTHPNIVGVYEIGSDNGVDFIAMEFVEGKTLEELVPTKGLPLAKVLDYGAQIAAGLARAHVAGVIHRDLKPGNIMVTRNGLVKLLDFGLARRVQIEPGQATTLTVEGEIAGTPAYMSPEQAEGRQLDARSDVFSFGLVLYRMLCGRPAFSGDTAASVMAAVLREEPAPLGEKVPREVERIVRRCLHKDPAHRWQSVSDIHIVMEELAAGRLADAAPARVRQNRLPWILAGAMALLAAALGWVYLRDRPVEMPLVSLTLAAPENTILGSFAVSPDGSRVAFGAISTDGRSRLWVRPLDAAAAQPLAGTEGGERPFWSPDSRSIGFAASGQLKRVDAAGGPVITLADAPFFQGGTWNRDGVILFVPTHLSYHGGAVQRVPATGGEPSAASKPNETDRVQVGHRQPWFLPGGRLFLFTVAPVVGSERGTVRAGSLGSLETRDVLEVDGGAVYASGHLLFRRGSTLMAQPFEQGRLSVTGNAVPIAENIRRFSVSENGVLVFEPWKSNERTLAWFDRGGKRLSTVGEPGLLGRFHLSRDGRKAAVGIGVGNVQNIWIYDLLRGFRSRLTFGEVWEQEAVWSPDGSMLVFSSNRRGREDLYRKASGGTGPEELLYADEIDKRPKSWSPDGKFLLYSAISKTTQDDIWVLPLTPERVGAPLKPFPFLQTAFYETREQFSPDGRWVVYQSNESGRNEIYVAQFPGAGGKQQVSTGGGDTPRWRGDGREILYLDPDRRFVAVEVSPKAAGLELGEPHRLFAPGGLFTGGFGYDVSADGQRILAVVAGEANTALTLVLNWTVGLKKK
ncbi:MAG: protein kinase [Acidobacteria bacterium]|nr:protein kinase [Acidobacteriota bacterium]